MSLPADRCTARTARARRPDRPVPAAVGAVVRRDDELLLVRRARPPARGAWSLPGGRIRFGEDARAAVAREVLEETGLVVVVTGFAGWAQRIHTDDDPPTHYVILDFHAEPVDPARVPRPGDDAAEVAWVPLAALGALELVPGLAEFLAECGILPSSPDRP